MRIRSPGFRIGAAYDVAFSRSGRVLAQVGRRVVAYDVGARKSLVRSQWHYPHPAYAALAPDDCWLAVRSTTGAMAVLELPSGDPLSRLPPMTDVADDSALLAGPTGEHLVEACRSGTLRVRRVRDLAVEYLEQHPADSLDISASSDGTLWAIGFRRRQAYELKQPPSRIELRRWPLNTSDRSELSVHAAYVYALSLAPDGRRLATLEQRFLAKGVSEYVLSVISTATGIIEQQAADKSWRPGDGLAWSPDGLSLVVCTTAGHALLDASTLHVKGHLGGEYPSDAAYSPDGRLLALGYWSHGLVLPTDDLSTSFSGQMPVEIDPTRIRSSDHGGGAV